MTIDLSDPKMTGYRPVEDFATTDADASSARIRDMPYGKRREDLSVAPNLLDFGDCVTGLSSYPQTILLVNSGYDLVTIHQVVPVGDFVLIGPVVTEVLPGQTVPLQVKFAPSRAGAITGGVYIDTGNAAGQEFVKLIGTGLVNPDNLPVDYVKRSEFNDLLARVAILENK